MSELSKAQEMLIICLKALGVSPDGVKVIMLLIPEDWRIAEMADFLLKTKMRRKLKSLKKQFALVRWKNHNWTEKERPESEAFSLYYSDQITLTRSTASRAVRSASRAAGIAPVTSKMV